MNTNTSTSTESHFARLQYLVQKVSVTEYELAMTKSDADVTTHGDGGAAEAFAKKVPAAEQAYLLARLDLADFLDLEISELQEELGESS